MPRTITAQHDRLPLSRPFRISRGVKTVADVIVVTIAEEGISGRGEAVPYARYGERIDSAIHDVDRVRGAIAGGAGRIDLLELLPAGAARNAIDCALWDLEARRSGRDVAAMIGAPAPHRMASALTIGIDTPAAMAFETAKVAGAPLLKVKVDAEDPAARIRAVRAAAPDAALIVDPNESWDRRLVEAMQDTLAELKIGLLEQPVPADTDGWLGGFERMVPICADESIHIASDLGALAERYDYVNIKLDKAGGLTAALELAYGAQKLGLGLMTGCMISSSLSIAPALHIARMSEFVDLDGPIWLKDDRPGGVADEHGFLVPPVHGFWGTS
jgi:L-alanine-DL-glutamate epimerase-like enolase superfamily enzyme